MRIILCYDIADKKRLTKVANLVCQYMFRLQFSVYYADLTEKQLNSLTEQLKTLINHKQDKVSIFTTVSLCRAVLYKRQTGTMVCLYDETGKNML